MNISLGRLDNTMIDELSVVEPDLTPRESPGAMLAAARKELNWSVEDVAANLNLRIVIIEAIELDDYTKLPGPTFVRGYQRSYARLLGLDEETVVETENLISVTPSAVSSPISAGIGTQVFSERAERRGGRGWLVWVVMALVIVVAWSLSGIKLWGPDGVLTSLGVNNSGVTQSDSEISVQLTPESRSGTTE